MRRGYRGIRVALLGILTLFPAVGDAAAPRPLELPVPELAVTVVPLSLNLTRPLLEPPETPALPAPPVDLGAPPLPRFSTVVPKPFPPTREPGLATCTFAFGRAASLAECGVYRVLEGDLPGAREALEESLIRDPRGPQAAAAYVWLGEVAFREGRYDEAEHRYRRALPLNPPAELVPSAALGIGWLALRRGDLGEAQRAFALALSSGPSPGVAVVTRFLDGVARLLAGRTEEALGLWDALAAGSPPAPIAAELSFWRGVAQARLGQADQALEALDAFLAAVPATHPLAADAIVQSGWVALGRGMPDDAVRRFLWAQLSGPRAELVAQLRGGLVRAYLALGDSLRARDMARLLAADWARDPVVPQVLLLIADAAVQRGATAEALDLYRELLARGADSRLLEYATYRLAETLARQGRTGEAERHYRTLRERGRVEAIAQRAAYRLGLLALRGQRPAEARVEGEALLRAGVLPELREAALLLTGEGAARGDDPNRAVRLFRLALRDYPTSPWAGVTRVALGWALFKDGEHESALREWQEAGRRAPDLESAILAYLATAEISLRQGREAESLAALRELGKLAPAHPLADMLALNRGILLVRAQEYAAAVQELEPLVPRITEPGRQALLRRALGIARYHLSQFDAAEHQFRQAAYWAPAESSSWLGAGLAALAQSRLDEAEKALGIARLAAAPGVSVPASYVLILVAARRRDDELFRQRATGFVDRYPAHPATGLLLYGLIRLALERKELDQADGWIQRLLRDQAGSEYVTDALIMLAGAARERPALARQTYRELLARSRDAGVRTDAWLGLGEAALALGDGADAQQALDSFLGAAPPDDPRAAHAMVLLVRAHEMQGRRDRVIAAAEAFLARFPTHPLVPSIQLTRGQLLLPERRWREAQEALEAARDTGEPPVAAPAQFYLGELHRARGEPEAAIAAYLGVTYLYPDSAPWAARGLQGAIQSYLARQMPREAAILVRKLLARPGLEPDLAQWARRALAGLGPIPGEDPGQILRKGVARP